MVNRWWVRLGGGGGASFELFKVLRYPARQDWGLKERTERRWGESCLKW